MREKLNDEALDFVAGGTVYLSYDKMKIGFSSTGEKYNLVNCEFRDAQNLAQDLWLANQHLGDAGFDALVKSEFEARGWI